MSRIGILGGTFNPIHNGHIRLAQYCKTEMNLDRVLLIPDNTPPHKSDKELASGDDRLQMCRLACKGIDWLEVSNIELLREGKSYTYETLVSLKEIYPNDELFLIVGADMFLTLHQWKNPSVIFNCASIIAVPRDSSDRDVLLGFYEETLKPMGSNATVLPSPVMTVSSTFIRENICEYKIIKELIAPEVYEYITSNGLYRK